VREIDALVDAQNGRISPYIYSNESMHDMVYLFVVFKSECPSVKMRN